MPARLVQGLLSSVARRPAGDHRRRGARRRAAEGPALPVLHRGCHELGNSERRLVADQSPHGRLNFCLMRRERACFRGEHGGKGMQQADWKSADEVAEAIMKGEATY
jgi:hypothetical protein